ncbi:MAG TPA: CHRD domain-containing protein [Gaiellaceae bacterium]
MRRSIRLIVPAAAAAITLLVAATGQAGSEPSLAWTPSSNGTYDFGSVVAGQTVSQEFTLTNEGHKVKGLTVSLSGSPAFTITADTCADVKKVDAKRTCSVTVAYSPVSASDAATLSVEADKPDSDASLALTGSGALRFVATGPNAAGLSPLNENPQHPESSGSGHATITWDTTTNMMTVDVTFAGLTTPATASHIHCCVAPPGTAGVATTTPTFPGFPVGATSGTYLHTFDMTAASSYNPAFIPTHGGTVAAAEAALFAGIQAGQAYLNIHSQMFPAGELRGFLLPG